MCGMTKKGHILVNLGQIKDENPPKQHAILKFWGIRKYQKKFKKGIVYGHHTQ